MTQEQLRMQMLAGIITESQYVTKLNEMEGDPEDYYGYQEPVDPNDYAESNESEYQFDVMDILNRNGVDEDYFDSMGGKEVESGTEEWMDIVSDVTGEDAYGDLSPEAESKIQSFIQAMEAMGIELI
jgi:hypothetical protein